MKIKSKIFSKLFFAACYTAATMQVAYAEDIEIFFAPTSSTANIKPNVVFAIDTSGSMTGKINGERKIDIVKDVMDELLTDIKDVNAGLMRFNAGTSSGWDTAYGGPILFPALDVDLPANPVVFKEIDEGSDDSSENDLAAIDLTSNSLQIDGTAAYTALRFTNLNIPQGATIKNASISFTAYGDSSGGAKFEIVGHKVADAPELTATAGDISTRLVAEQTVASEEWLPSDWLNGQAYLTDDISSVVQEIVDLSAWCGGNDLVIIIKGTDASSRVAYSAEGEAAAGGGSDDTDAFTAPRIKVEYDNTLPSGANGCYSSEFSTQIDRDSDDANNRGDSYYLNFDESGYYGNDEVALSFRDINVPQGADITEATIELVSAYTIGGTASATILGVDDATPAMGSSVLSLGAGAFTAGVSWSFPNFTFGETYTSSDISSIVETIVARGGWSSGNSMSFRIDSDSGSRYAYSHNGSTSRAAKLNIKYRATYVPGAITIREDLRATIQDLNATGYTPISDTIAEAGQYFTGGKVTFGISRDGNRYNRMSHELSYDGSGSPYTPAGCTDSSPNASECAGEKIVGTPNYVSPIEESCQSSHFVFLTDGAPTSHHSETEDIYQAWTGSSCNDGDPYRDCAIDIAGYLHNNDVSPLAGRQTVTTHMIGFGSGADPQLMKDMADAGGGGHYSADDKAELVAALTQIVASIANVNTTFVSTGVTVNQFNRLTHNEELYYSLFSPQSNSVWPGNIKRYRLNGGVVVDVNGNAAVDVLSSEFKDDAKSWWSSDSDGNKVENGGAASKLSVARTIYSDLNSNNLADPSNVFNETNVTTAMLGAIDDNDRKTIIHWALGYDTDDENYDVNDISSTPAHNKMGDPLHSQPTVISYKSSSPSKNKAVVYVGTNHGYLHAIDTDANSGEELWAFIPNQLLTLLSDLQKDVVGTHKYGLDGSITVYIDDVNGNGSVDVDDGEKAYLYVGMRRGGSSYFALDISDPEQPNLMFTIDPATTGFGNIGQTWSRPIIGKMNISNAVNSDKLVMMFGGGYDTTQDTAGTASATDTVGKGIYIADAYTGAFLWHSSSATQAAAPAGALSTMNAVPANITAFDIDDDQLIDHIYAADTKAQIFRFDIDNSNSTVTGGRIANLQSAADVANNRRFFASPDAALIRLQEENFISISIGSGYRAHPLDENITDYFYMIKDKGVLSKTFDMDVTMNDLVNVTSLIGDADANGESDALEVINDDSDPKPGWYISFTGSGEKVIERSITFNNAVFFTTYVPPGSSSSVCEAAAGGARFYGMKIVDGNPYVDTNYDGTLTEVDRAFTLAGSGIAPPPQVLITPEGPTICVGIQCGGQLEDFPPPLPRGLTGIRWRKN